MAIQHFTQLYTANPDARGQFIIGLFLTINRGAMRQLSRAYTREEIHEALYDMNPLKAPGPNGYHEVFYQKAWNIVRPSVISFVKKILTEERYPRA